MLSLATEAWGAGLFKCAETTGPPVYQDRPCSGETLRDLAKHPPTLSVLPFDVPSVRPSTIPPRAERSPKPPKIDRRKEEAERRSQPAAVSERRHLRDGMSDGEVLARLGPPDLQTGKQGRKMRWTYLPAPGDPQTVTLVRFEEGKVTAVERATMR